MDIEDSVVDLSVKSLPPELSELKALTASGLTITPARPPVQCGRSRQSRSGRGETDNSPDIVLLPARPPHVSVHAGSGTSSPNFQTLYGGLSIHHSLNPLAATHPRTPARHDIYQPSPPKQAKTNSHPSPLGKSSVPVYQPPDYSSSKYAHLSGGTSITLNKEKVEKDVAPVPVNIVLTEPPKLDMDESSSEDEAEEETAAELDNIFSIPAVALTPEQAVSRQLSLRQLREELRREETKLVLLKKIRQSQQAAQSPTAASAAKDGQIPPPAHRSTAQIGTIGSGTSIQQVAPSQPPPAHSNKTLLKPRESPIAGSVPTTPTGLSVCPSSSPLASLPLTASLPGGATLTQGTVSSTQRNSSSAVSITPSVTITPAPQPAAKPNTESGATAATAGGNSSASSSGGGSSASSAAAASPSGAAGGTPQQRQAAAKLALRKQLEKTLLQIPPPKPPPPEMSFIPSPANADFVYLLGLEHVVDFLTSYDRVTATHPGVKVCSQCGTDFTPAWKWQPATATRDEASPAINAATNAATGGAVVCERCVSGNVKRTLKAEHTARLKTAFVRALQQEHEIERRMAQPSPPAPSTTTSVSVNGSSAVSTPAPAVTIAAAPVAPAADTKHSTPSATITPASILPSLEKFASSTLPDKYSLANNKDISIESASNTATAVPTTLSISSRHHNNIQVTLRPANPSPGSASGSSRATPAPSPSHHASASHNAHASHNASHASHNAHASSHAAHANKTSTSRSRQHDQHDSHTSSRSHHSDRSSTAGSSSASTSAVERQNAKHQQQLAAAQLAAFEQHSAAAMHALQQQLFRGITSGSQAAAAAAAMMQFNPLLYPYQLAMAAGLAGKAGSGLPSVTDLQRAAELHRQYLLDMIPSQPNNHHQQWTNKK